jgi:hypothetical protein
MVCCITLQQRSGEYKKARVSHWFEHEVHAELYLNNVLENLDFFLKFYQVEDQNLYYNDDFRIEIESKEKCQDLPFHTDDSSDLDIVDLSVEVMLDLIERW